MQVTLNDTAIQILDSSHRSRDDQGFLVVKDNPVAVAGVFSFLRKQVDAEATAQNGNEIVQVLRSPESLQKAADLFCNKPIVHHHKWIGKEADRQNADGCIGSQVHYRDGALYADLIIYNPVLIDSIESGACRQLSPGYNAVVTRNAGMYEGQAHAFSIEYTGVNHLGVVENGRAGARLSIQDKQDFHMEINNNASVTNRFVKRASALNTTANQMDSNTVVKKEAKTKQECGAQRVQDTTVKRQQCKQRINNNRQVMQRAHARMTAGSISAEDFNFIYKQLNDENTNMKAKIKALETAAAEAKKHNDAAAEARALDDALATIHKSLPEFKAYGERRVPLLFSRAYHVYTGHRLADGADPRTAFLEAIKHPRKLQKVIDTNDTATSNYVAEALHKWHLSRHQARG